MTNRLTDEQRERIARAMGWKSVNGRWWRDDMPAAANTLQHMPRYDEPGELHEGMIRKFRVHSGPFGHGPDFQAWTEQENIGHSNESRPIAECLAVLAYLDSEEGEK